MTIAGQEEIIVLMDDARIRRTLRRISYEIIEQNYNRESVRFVGLNNRGFQTANLIKDFVEKAGLKTEKVFQIDVNKSFESQQDCIPDFSNCNVILIDDVIFSGKTMLKALGYILKNGDPDNIQIAVLVDRGHRVYPVQPSFIGLHYPTKLKEHVKVEFGSDVSAMRVILHSDYGN